jgi:uncharacterized protein
MNSRNLSLYLALSFGFSWAILALGTWLSPDNQAGSLFTGVLYMWGPALATLVISRLRGGPRLRTYGWQFERLRWPWLLANALLPLVVLLLTLGMVYVLGNVAQIEGFGYLDLSRAGMEERMEELMVVAGQDPDDAGLLFTELDLPVGLLLVGMLFGGLIGGVTLNLVAAFGEELGWRGLMLRETRHLGYLPSAVLIGLVWGLWHAPLVYLGHNYPGYPLAGIGMMVAFCIAMSLLMNLLAMKSGSIVGPSAFHGVTNGVAGSTLVLIHDANPLLGGAAGVGGVLAILLLAAGLLVREQAYLKAWPQHSYDPAEEEQATPAD